MARTSTMSSFWRGVRGGLPFLLVVTPFAALFGVLATEAGLDLVQVMVFSLAVFAGAAQFTALQLMQDNAPTVIVLASALAVNLRVAMYSASITPYLGKAPLWQRALAAFFLVDQSFAVPTLEYEKRPEMTIPERMAFYFGVLLPITPAWYIFSYLGAVAGTALPTGIGLDMALPLTFIAMVGPMLRTAAHVVAAFVGILLAILFASVPHNLGLILAGLGGMMAGAQMELILKRRANHG